MGADLSVASLVVVIFKVDLREGMEARRVLMVASMAASSSGEAASAGSLVEQLRQRRLIIETGLVDVI